MSATTEQQMKLSLSIQGMTCSSCANRIERKLNKLDGVEALVNYATELASVTFDSSKVQPVVLIQAVEAAGYGATMASPDLDNQAPETDPIATLRKRVLISAALALPVLVMSMVPAAQFHNWQWLALQLTTPVVVWGAWPFHRAAWTNLKHSAATMDTLVSIGVMAAWLWSLVALFVLDAGVAGMKMSFSFTASVEHARAHLYLEVASAVTVFLLAGRYFEALSKRNAGAALKALAQIGAKDVAILDDDETETRKPIESLSVGNRFVVRPGEKVATDGTVENGDSAIDMSMLTGESVPVSVASGSEVVGGTLNTSGRLVVRATKVGNNTALAQIAKLVTDAQSGKAPVQKLADRVSGVFVPVVIALAVATLGFWLGNGSSATFAFTCAVAVLIAACPCALGLATPTALLVGTGRGAQMGILIKGPEVLESTRRVDTIVLDKTGTITTGVMTLIDVVVARDVERTDALRMAGAVESDSEHPIAQAIARRAKDEIGPLPPTQSFKNTEGFGVNALVESRSVTVGRVSFLKGSGLHLPNDLEVAMVAIPEKAHTIVGVGWDGQVRALLEIADAVKPSSAEAITRLKRLGLSPVLLTGDNNAVADTVARAVDIQQVIAEVSPQDKVNVVTRLQNEGHVVAMVGDGVNDAAALAAADLGMSIGTGTDVAVHASDLTLVSGDLRAAADAIQLSRGTLMIIKGNLFWAFAYNVAALPLAAVGLLNPLIAGAAMAFSSVFVVSNSLRLRSFKAT